ncbi:MAG: flavodoxin-dependent (E)-4-hydroxy-3-methylbut-2-enyl-diphosphate synthase [candidate division WOR-3 bacterium]|nr:MAG: flavodoxin-dependent (E)-4-hydroxy-3-methylbut-2-enyl-diphosphate synthase [candidate division WOR-3 bacterium]
MRQRKRVVRIGDVLIGGEHPIAVQSMTKTKTFDLENTLRQIRRVQRAGCELIRCAVVNRDDVAALPKIRAAITMPLIADVHFDYRLALGAIKSGADKIRINPGNIGERWKVTEIIQSAKDRNIPIRIGINSGSLPDDVLAKYARPTVKAIVQTAKRALSVFESNDFTNVVISAKGVDVRDTIEVYRALSEQYDFPLHVGITEAGLAFEGAVKSAVGIGVLLNLGIGDTIRVSLTADPTREVVAAYAILRALGLRKHGPLLISCPTCGRCDVDLEGIAVKVDRRLKKYGSDMKVAVMGCVVNGPGEVRDADFGIACGKNVGAVFARGKEIRRVKERDLIDALFEVIDENFDN